MPVPRALYNRGVRTGAVVLLVLSLAACNVGTQSKEAVRQGVIDHLGKSGFNMQAMEVTLTAVDLKGSQADATVSIGLKGGNPAQGMMRKYHLELQGKQWAVTSSQDASGSPHSGGAASPGGAMPGGESPHGAGAIPASPNPHGGGATAPGGGGKMPSPNELPPSGKKK